jgi:hypothetical protein
MARGLSVSGVVNVTVTISPLAAGQRNFGVALVLGDSAVIDTAERVRAYRTLDEVAAEFGTSAAEYKAADLYFSQSPQPNLLYIGRWASGPSHAVLHGGVLSGLEQDMTSWTAITAGSMAITTNGTVRTLSALDFSAQTNLNGVAAVIDAALTGATVVFDSIYDRFDVISDTTGTSSTLTYATPTGSGTDISAKLKLTSALASAPVAGLATETPLAAAQAAADRSSDWYGLHFASAVAATDNQLVDVASYIEGSARSRIIAVTTQNVQTLDPLITTDIATRLKNLSYKRSFVQFSQYNPYAALSALGRAFTVNFEAADTTLTLKFKQEPGVVAETLTETQALTLRAKNCNVFVNYDNDTAIIQEGKMANGYFFDEVHGLDWLQNATQTDVWNLLYQNQTKIPQTDAGISQIVAVIDATMTRAVRNGLAAPGIWKGPNIGPLRTGQALAKGWLTIADLVANQPQADREARKAPPIQVALKLAGAVHFADVLISVNR